MAGFRCPLVLLLSVCLPGIVAVTNKYFMVEECGGVVDMGNQGLASVRLEFTKSEEYHASVDCLFYVQAPEGRQLLVKILNMDISCDGDYLQIMNGNNASQTTLDEWAEYTCGRLDYNPVFTSTGRILKLHFHSNEEGFADGFRLLLTAFRTADTCLPEEFKCDAYRRCISEDLKCDGYDNCGDKSDECPLSLQAIVGITVGCAVVVIYIILVVIFFVRRKIRRGRKDKQLQRLQSTTTITEPESSILRPDPDPVYQNLFSVSRHPVYLPVHDQTLGIKAEPVTHMVFTVPPTSHRGRSLPPLPTSVYTS